MLQIYIPKVICVKYTYKSKNWKNSLLSNTWERKRAGESRPVCGETLSLYHLLFYFLGYLKLSGSKQIVWPAETKTWHCKEIRYTESILLYCVTGLLKRCKCVIANRETNMDTSAVVISWAMVLVNVTQLHKKSKLRRIKNWNRKHRIFSLQSTSTIYSEMFQKAQIWTFNPLKQLYFPRMTTELGFLLHTFLTSTYIFSSFLAQLWLKPFKTIFFQYKVCKPIIIHSPLSKPYDLDAIKKHFYYNKKSTCILSHVL